MACICFDAFNALNATLGLPPEWPSVETVAAMFRERLASPGCRSFVAVDPSGAVVGSNFLVLGEVSAFGPLSVDPTVQRGGVGRLLMEAVLGVGASSVQAVQVANNLGAYALYGSLGFVPREQLAVLTGQVTDAPEGYEVRPMELADVSACQAVYREVNGYSRDVEIERAARRAFGWADPYVVTQGGVVVGYTTGLSMMGHLACTSTDAMCALYAGASGPESELRLPGRLYPEVLRWALGQPGVRLLRLETLISIGDYSPPRLGVYCPAISY